MNVTGKQGLHCPEQVTKLFFLSLFHNTATYSAFNLVLGTSSILEIVNIQENVDMYMCKRSAVFYANRLEH